MKRTPAGSRTLATEMADKIPQIEWRSTLIALRARKTNLEMTIRDRLRLAREKAEDASISELSATLRSVKSDISNMEAMLAAAGWET